MNDIGIRGPVIGPVDVWCAHCGEPLDVSDPKAFTFVMTSRNTAFMLHNGCLRTMHSRAFHLDSEEKHRVLDAVRTAMLREPR